MEPNVDGPCDEHKEHPVNPRCGECGWPEYRHVEPEAPGAAGPVLRAQIAALGISLPEACRRLDYAPRHMNLVLKGALPISVDFAVHLARVLGLEGRRLLHVQAEDEYARRYAALAAEDEERT